MKNPSRLKVLSSTLALPLFRGTGIGLSALKNWLSAFPVAPSSRPSLPIQTAGISWLLARLQTSTARAIFSGDSFPLYNPHRKR
jgi:hypothetical protein